MISKTSTLAISTSSKPISSSRGSSRKAPAHHYVHDARHVDLLGMLREARVLIDEAEKSKPFQLVECFAETADRLVCADHEARRYTIGCLCGLYASHMLHRLQGHI